MPRQGHEPWTSRYRVECSLWKNYWIGYTFEYFLTLAILIRPKNLQLVESNEIHTHSHLDLQLLNLLNKISLNVQ